MTSVLTPDLEKYLQSLVHKKVSEALRVREDSQMTPEQRKWSDAKKADWSTLRSAKEESLLSTIYTKPSIAQLWAETGNTTPPSLPQQSIGWSTSTPPNSYFFNFLQQRGDQFLLHINQQGICVWDDLTDYPISGLAKGSDGNVYTGLTTPNVGNDPTSSPANWQLALSTTGAVTPAQFQNSAQIYALDTGSVANTLVAVASPAYGSYVNGTKIIVKCAHTLTGASTLNVNGNGAHAILVGGQPTVAGEMVVNREYEFIYNSTGTYWELMNPERVAIYAKTRTLTSVAIPASIYTAVTFGAPVHDPNGWCSGTRITPTRPGSYLVFGFLLMQDPSVSNQEFSMQVSVSGVAEDALDTSEISTSQAEGLAGSLTAIANGTTDYFELKALFTSDSQLVGGYFGAIYLGT